MRIEPSESIIFKDPILPSALQQFGEIREMFDSNPSLELADHMSAAAREIIFRCSRVTMEQALQMRELFSSAADAIAAQFPQAADEERPMPEQYATHLRRRVGKIDEALNKVTAAV